MEGLIGAVAGCALGALIVAGYGAAAARALSLPARLGPGSVLALGLAVLAALGGLLNLLSVATRAGVVGVLVCGLLLVIAAWRRRAAQSVSVAGVPWALLPVAALVVVNAAATLPADIFGVSDDLTNYLVRPLRMAASGSVAGGAFDSLGVDTLGSLAFLQALVLPVASIAWLPAFDAVFCLLLAGLLIEDIGRQSSVGPAMRFAAGTLLVVLPPQTINVSAVYAGGAALLLALLLSARLCDARGAGSPSSGHGPGLAFALGLSLALLAGLKLTFAPIAFAAPLILLAVMPPRVRDGAAGPSRLRVATWLAAGLAAGLLPWLAVLVRQLPDGFALVAGGLTRPQGLGGLPALLTLATSAWGGTPLHFGLLLATTPAVALLAVGAPLAGFARGLRAVLLAFSLPLLPAALLSAWMVDAQHAARYYAPLLLALLPVALLLASRLPRVRALPLVLLIALVGVLHGAGLATRVTRAVQDGSLMSFPTDDGDRLVVTPLLSSEVGTYVRGIQALTPPGSTLLVLSALAVHMDFARQPVVVPNDTGLMAGWNTLPIGAPPEALGRVLRERGVDFVLVQQRGSGAHNLDWYRWAAGSTAPVLQRQGETVLWLIPSAIQLASTRHVLHFDGGLLLYDLHTPAGGAVAPARVE